MVPLSVFFRNNLQIFGCQNWIQAVVIILTDTVFKTKINTLFSGCHLSKRRYLPFLTQRFSDSGPKRGGGGTTAAWCSEVATGSKRLTSDQWFKSSFSVFEIWFLWPQANMQCVCRSCAIASLLCFIHTHTHPHVFFHYLKYLAVMSHFYFLFHWYLCHNSVLTMTLCIITNNHWVS